MRAVAIAVGLLMGVLSCGERQAGTDRDTLTQRQRDSVIGASQLPGAQGVRGALKVSDSASARREQEDAAVQEP
jgi:hypothetical protein